MIEVEVANLQTQLTVDENRLMDAAGTVLEGEGVQAGRLSLAVVSDARIHQLNRQYLQHDYPTDVLSFLLEDGADGLEGEVVVSAETAIRQATEVGWAPDAELLLYVLHGTLHLVGYDDRDAEQRRRMRERERFYLRALGIDVPAAGDQRADVDRGRVGRSMGDYGGDIRC